MSRFPRINPGSVERLDQLIRSGHEVFSVEQVVILAPEPSHLLARYSLEVTGTLGIVKPGLALPTARFELDRLNRVDYHQYPGYPTNENILAYLRGELALPDQEFLLTGYHNSGHGRFLLANSRHLISAYDRSRRPWLFGVVLPHTPIPSSS